MFWWILLLRTWLLCHSFLLFLCIFCSSALFEHFLLVSLLFITQVLSPVANTASLFFFCFYTDVEVLFLVLGWLTNHCRVATGWPARLSPGMSLAVFLPPPLLTLVVSPLPPPWAVVTQVSRAPRRSAARLQPGRVPS